MTCMHRLQQRRKIHSNFLFQTCSTYYCSTYQFPASTRSTLTTVPAVSGQLVTLLLLPLVPLDCRPPLRFRGWSGHMRTTWCKPECLSGSLWVVIWRQGGWMSETHLTEMSQERDHIPVFLLLHVSGTVENFYFVFKNCITLGRLCALSFLSLLFRYMSTA